MISIFSCLQVSPAAHPILLCDPDPKPGHPSSCRQPGPHLGDWRQVGPRQGGSGGQLAPGGKHLAPDCLQLLLLGRIKRQ